MVLTECVWYLLNACGTNVGDEKCIQGISGKKVNKREYMEVIGVDKKIILKGTLKKQT